MANFILVRVAPEDKRLIVSAARRAGKTITAFLLEPALQTAKRQKRPEVSVVEYFRRYRKVVQHGGGGPRPGGRRRTGEDERGYEMLGVRLIQHLDGRRGWAKRLDAADRDKMWQWFQAHLPECWRLVPYRRRRAFLLGVRHGLVSRARRRAGYS